MWRGGGPRAEDTRRNSTGWAGYDAEFHHFAHRPHGKGVNLLFSIARFVIRNKRFVGTAWHKQYDVNAALKTVFPDWMKLKWKKPADFPLDKEIPLAKWASNQTITMKNTWAKESAETMTWILGTHEDFLPTFTLISMIPLGRDNLSAHCW